MSKELPVALSWSGRKVDDTENAIEPTAASSQMDRELPATPSQSGQKADDTKNAKEPPATPPCVDLMVGKNETLTEKPKAPISTSRTDRTVKPTAKAKDAMNSQATAPLSRKSQKTKTAESAKRPSTQRVPSLPQQSLEVEDLIVQLTNILDNWDNDDSTNVMATHNQETSPTNEPLEGDPIRIFASKIHSANAVDQDHFACSTQLVVEEPETYARAMQGPNAPRWAKIMEKELDKLHKNDTWTLVQNDKIEPDHRPLV